MAEWTGGETCDSPIDSQGPRVKNDWQFFGECQCPDRLAVARPHFIGEHHTAGVGLINIRTSLSLGDLDSDQTSRTAVTEVDAGDRKREVPRNGRERREGRKSETANRPGRWRGRLRRRSEGRRSAWSGGRDDLS